MQGKEGVVENIGNGECIEGERMCEEKEPMIHGKGSLQGKMYEGKGVLRGRDMYAERGMLGN